MEYVIWRETRFFFFCFRPARFQRSSMGPSVGFPIQKRGRLSGRSGDLLSARPPEKVHESFFFLIHIRFHCKMLFCKIVQDGIDESINNVNCNKCQEN